MKIKLLSLIASMIISNGVYAISINSKDFQDNSALNQNQIADVFGCTGKNLSPELSWSDAPAATKSFAITAYDPDAPTGSGFWHWVVYDINSKVSSVPSGAGSTKKSNIGIEALNDANTVGYAGACPPKGNGSHRYIFTIYALDIDKLQLPKNAPSAIIRFTILKHAIAKASITGNYQR